MADGCCFYCGVQLKPNVDSASSCIACTIWVSRPENRDREFDRAREFDCSECGRHIIVLAGPINEFRLCAACLSLPGWHTIPALRRLFGLNQE